ncbi:hypothetical protein SUGI_0599650 [Cryptomeria japonica]|uniref:uncharacterized protein LOC131035130 n=1 Tax=Cryptomeria japonica TaxID=3369 RepID=UPI002414BE45|nr:uncharacterized protein LOC131035130 [Cryptomeria japonica]GLJ30311.1 hypothetical protein SUGI_0599650 [Cryptomeria japonica]
MACATAALSLKPPLRAHRAQLGQAPCKLCSPTSIASKRSRIVVNCSSSSSQGKKKNEVVSVAGLTSLALTAATVIPEIADAAGPGVSPSLKNFLLSIVAGGVVVAVLGIAVIGVSNFDPVKRGR